MNLNIHINIYRCMTMKNVKKTLGEPAMLELGNMVKHGIDPETQKRSLHIQTICKIDLVGSQRLGTCWFDLYLGLNITMRCIYM